MAAAGEDSIIQKLESAAADGMRAGGGLSAQRVQTVMRFTQRVIKDYERKHGTDNFLSDDFKACDMKCVEFEMVRFSSEVLGVVTGTPIDDDGAEEAEEDLNDLVARRNFLRMQDWDYNGSVLDEKLRPIDQKLLGSSNLYDCHGECTRAGSTITSRKSKDCSTASTNGRRTTSS